MRGDPWFWRVKAAQRDLIARCGGIARAAAVAGCSPSLIGKANNPNEDGFLTARQKAALEADAGDPVVTRVEAELLGYRLEPAAPRAEAIRECAYSAHAAVLSEAGDVARSFAERVRDGHFSGADAQAVDRELAELIDQAKTFRRVCAAVSAEQARGGGDG